MKHLIFAAVALTMGHAALACTCGTGTHQVGDVCVADASSKGSKSNATQNQSQAQNQSASGGTARSNATGGSVGAVNSQSSSAGGAASVGNVSGGAAQGGAGGNSRSDSSSSGGSAQGGSSSVSDSSESGASSNAQVSNYAAARIPVSSALAGFQQTTAGCRFAEGLGVQLTSAGTSVGFTFKDHDCVRFELAQFFYSRGQDIAGDRVICAVHEVRQVLGEDCEALVHEIVAVKPADAVTHAEMRAGLRSLNQQKDTSK